ncbi:MAG: hypothetical protein EP329_03405 [Deltaproteobacteria bacterium]|nr:MAG: hypothetical protein EP329_03405 [Deltaproteobacteria bacterium]
MRTATFTAIALLALAGARCASDGGGVDRDADTLDQDSGPPPDGSADTVGELPEPSFQVSLWESESAAGGSRTAFATAGRRYPDDEPGAGDLVSGPCRLLFPAPYPFCDPACGPGTICVADDVCEAPDPPIGAGDIRVTGLKSALTLHPETQWQYYGATFDPEPSGGELFDEGTPITATAVGDSVAAFTVTAQGVGNLATDLACPLTFSEVAALEVRWTPSNQAGDRLRFTLQSGNHGSQFVRIVCDSADTGVLTVDAALMTAYLTEQRPVESWRLERFREGLAPAGDAAVALFVGSDVGCSWMGR